MQSIQRSALPRPDQNPADCRHSREAFDVAFAVVTERTGLTIADRVVHAAMVSLHRLGRLGEVTQEQIAEWARVSRRTVIRACQAMVEAGLLLVKRRGQGLPNAYQLVGIDQDALDGRSDKRASPRVPERANPARARHSSEKRTYDGRRSGYTPPSTNGGDYLETRYGRLQPRT